MTLGQSLLVIGALALLGILVLNANTSIGESTETMNRSEFGITAISLATSLVEEAQGKMFDQKIADSLTGPITSPTQLSAVLGKEGAEAYRGGAEGFNDFDDFNNIWLVYKNAPLDTASSPGSTYEFAVPGLRARYDVRVSVYYVDPNGDLNVPVAYQTFHKGMLVTVTSPSSRDTLRFPAVMSYWN